MGTLPFFLPLWLQLAAGCSGTTHWSTGRLYIIPWGFHWQQQLLPSWTHPERAQDAVQQFMLLSRWPKIFSACEHLLIQVGSAMGPRLWGQCWSHRVGSTIGAMWLERIRLHSIKLCWSQGRGEQWNCTASEAHMCFVTAALQEQDSVSNPRSVAAKTSLRAKTSGALSCCL